MGPLTPDWNSPNRSVVMTTWEWMTYSTIIKTYVQNRWFDRHDKEFAAIKLDDQICTWISNLYLQFETKYQNISTSVVYVKCRFLHTSAPILVYTKVFQSSKLDMPRCHMVRRVVDIFMGWCRDGWCRVGRQMSWGDVEA